MQELVLPFAFVFVPELKSAGSHFGVGLGGAVGATHDASLSAGGGAGVARAPGVDQSHTGAAFEKLERRPPAERASSDYGNVWLGFHAK